jgi:putative hemolysin
LIDYNFLLFFLSLSFSFFCSGSESALFSLSELKIQDILNKHPNRGKLILFLLEHPQKLLTTILIFSTFANIYATFVTAEIVKTYLPSFESWLVPLIMIFVIIIFGDIIPKTLAINISTLISLAIAPFWFFSVKILTPFIYIFKQISSFLVNINTFLFYRNVKEQKDYKIDEVIDVIKESRKHGIIDKDEELILGNIIEFTNADVWELMRPRNEIFSLSVDTKISDAVKLIKTKKFSRIPVWKNSEENIIGILYIKELLKINSDSKRKISYFKNILNETFYVPESMKAEKLLKNFQTTRNHLAIVIDEYGGVSGMITLEDVLESIIGEVIDKDDIKPLYYKYNYYMIEVEGRMDISEFNTVFRTNLKCTSSSALSGYILEKLKRLPKTGEIFIYDGLQFKITSSLPNKIEKILITKIRKIRKSGATK